MAWFKIILSAPNELESRTGLVSITYSTLVRTKCGKCQLEACISVCMKRLRPSCAAHSQFGVNYFVCATLLVLDAFRECSDWTTTLDDSRSQNFESSCAGQNIALLWENCKILNALFSCSLRYAWNEINIIKSNLGTRVFAGTPSKASSSMLKNSEQI